MEAAISRMAPITANKKCHQVQLNCLVTATAGDVAQALKLGQVFVVNGSDTTAVLVNRAMAQRTHMAHRPTTTRIRKG
jgi:hypothetical protein